MISKICNFFGDFKTLSASTAIAVGCQAISQSPIAKRVQQAALLTLGVGLLVNIGRKLSSSPNPRFQEDPHWWVPVETPPLLGPNVSSLPAPRSAKTLTPNLANTNSAKPSPIQSALLSARQILSNSSTLPTAGFDSRSVMAPYYEELAKYDQEHESHPELSKGVYSGEIASLNLDLHFLETVKNKTTLTEYEIERIQTRIATKTEAMKKAASTVLGKEFELTPPAHPIQTYLAIRLQPSLKGQVNFWEKRLAADAKANDQSRPFTAAEAEELKGLNQTTEQLRISYALFGR